MQLYQSGVIKFAEWLLGLTYNNVACTSFFVGGKEKKIKDIIIPTIEDCYTRHFGSNPDDTTMGDFYQAVCETVEY